MKGLSKLATILLLSTGIAFSSGKAIAGDKSLMSKGLHEMTLQERTQWNYDKSMIDYGNTDDPDESFKDYIVRGGSVVNQDGVKTKSDVEERSLNKRELKDDIDFFAFTREKTHSEDNNFSREEITDAYKKNFTNEEHIIFYVDFNGNYRYDDIFQKFYIIDKEDNNIIHYEEDISPLNNNFSYPNNRGISLNPGKYTVFYLEKDSKGKILFDKSIDFKVTN